MTEEPKICPFMSRPVVDTNPHGVQYPTLFCQQCLKEKCAAWGPKLEKHANCEDGCWTNGCRLIP